MQESRSSGIDNARSGSSKQIIHPCPRVWIGKRRDCDCAWQVYPAVRKTSLPGVGREARTHQHLPWHNGDITSARRLGQLTSRPRVYAECEVCFKSRCFTCCGQHESPPRPAQERLSKSHCTQLAGTTATVWLKTDAGGFLFYAGSQ